MFESRVVYFWDEFSAKIKIVALFRKLLVFWSDETCKKV